MPLSPQPGSNDTTAISLTDNAGLIFSSRWNGTQTVEQLLGGGNLQVRPAQLLDSASASGSPAGSLITAADVQRLLPAALAQWQAAGVEEDLLRSLQNVEIQIDDFSGDGLAWAMPGLISIDRDAGGFGWYIDATPYDHSEFSGGIGGWQVAGMVDLLTVITHELGHLVGHSEIFGDSNDIMGIALPIATRRLPSNASESVYAEQVDQAFAAATYNRYPAHDNSIFDVTREKPREITSISGIVDNPLRLGPPRLNNETSARTEQRSTNIQHEKVKRTDAPESLTNALDDEDLLRLLALSR